MYMNRNMMRPNSGQNPNSQHNAMQKLMGMVMGDMKPQLPSLPSQNIQGMQGSLAKMSPNYSQNRAQRFNSGNKMALLKSYAGISSLKSGFDPAQMFKF